MDYYNDDEWKRKETIVNYEAPPPAYQPYPNSENASLPAETAPCYQLAVSQAVFTTPAADNLGKPPVVVVTKPQQDPQHYVPVKQSFFHHIFWSCFAFWLCGVAFGLISFVLAIFARKSSEQGNHSKAQRLGKASMSLTKIGILLGCVAWGFVLWYLVTYYINAYWFGNKWYRYRICGISAGDCQSFYRGVEYDPCTRCCYIN